MGLDLAMLKLFGIKMIVIRLINILRHLVIGLGCQRFAVREYSHFQVRVSRAEVCPSACARNIGAVKRYCWGTQEVSPKNYIQDQPRKP